MAMWEAFQSLRSQLAPTFSKESVLCFVIDSSIAELLKWSSHAYGQESSDVVLDLRASSVNSIIFAETKATHVAFWVSHIDHAILDQMTTILQNSTCSQCFLVGHFTSASLKVSFPSVTGSVEEYITSRLAPVNVTYHFLSDFSYSLLSSSSLQSLPNFDCRMITSHNDRLVQPLMLNSMKDASSSTAEEYKCINEINAADLPSEIKTSLKQLAHSITGSIVCDLGIDPTESMFAVGKTSSLVGHSVLSMIENYADIRTGRKAEQSFGQLKLSNIPSSSSSASLVTGSLVLVDRLEDLITPITHGGEQPLLHRVLNAVKMDALVAPGAIDDTSLGIDKNGRVVDDTTVRATDEVLLDVQLRPEWCVELDSLLEDTQETKPRQGLSLPMSAVSTLTFQTIPSICFQCQDESSITESNLLRRLMSSSEEDGRNAIVDALKQQIQVANGQFPPPKKRGIGAELLALVQSLIKAPGARSESSVFQHLETVTHSHSLIALALTVIETMQRSSAKQFSSVCDWKAALDTRAARESDVFRALQQHEDLEITMAQILRPFTSTRSGNSGKGTKVAAKASVADGNSATEGPPDVAHAILLTIGIISMSRFRYEPVRVEFLHQLADALARHLIVSASDVELAYLRTLGVFRQDMQEIIDEARFEGLTTYEALEDAESTVECLRETLLTRLNILEELQEMHRYFMQKVVLKKTGGVSSSASAGGLSSETAYAALAASSYEAQLLRGVLKADERGLLARLVEDCFLYQRTQQSSPASLLLEHIQSPFQQMKNTGLGLLSKGLGSLGLGMKVAAVNETPHPGAQRVLVLFVLGGITYKEVAQVRAVLDKYSDERCDQRIILLSTRTISSEEILACLFRPAAKVTLAEAALPFPSPMSSHSRSFGRLT